MVLLVGGIVLLTIASLTRKRASTRWYAPFTVVVALATAATTLPLWKRVQGWDKLLWIDMPASPAARSAPRPGRSASTASGCSWRSSCAPRSHSALLADDYLRREGLNGPEFYALLLIRGLRCGGHGHGG